MEANRFDAPMETALVFSRQLLAYILCIHLLAASVFIFPLALPAWFRLLLLCACLVSGWWNCRKYLLMPAVTALAWHERADWSIRLADGRWTGVTTGGEQLVLSWLVIIKFVDETGRRYSVMVLPDMMPENAFRHLRVRLLGEAAQDPAGTGL